MTLTKEVLIKGYSRVFDLSPEAMKVTKAMNQMAVGKGDVRWKVQNIPLTSRTHYQTISSCEETAVHGFIQDQIQRGIIHEMKPEEKGFFLQSMFIPKKSGMPHLFIDFRRLNTYSDTWTSSLEPTIEIVRRIPNNWRYFSVIDLENGFYNVPLSCDIKELFCFEFKGRRY